MNKSYTIGVQCKCGEWVAVDIVPRVAADIKELAATDSQQLKPKMPLLEEVERSVANSYSDTKLSPIERETISRAYEYISWHFGH